MATLQPDPWARRAERGAYVRHLRAQQVAKAEIASVLRAAAKEAEERVRTIVGEGVGAQMRRAQLQSSSYYLRQQQIQVWGHVTRSTERALAAASAAAADANVFLVEYLARAGASSRLADQLVLAARSSAEVVRAKYLNDVRLSQLVYKNREAGIARVNRTVARGLAQNNSAKEIAASVRHLIRPDTPGGVSYAAMRLARTEINNAYHGVNTELFDRSPFVEAAKWELSASHLHRDECDDYADGNHDNLGAGVFLTDNVPGKPHPHCLPAGTEVAGSRAYAATARWWSDQICEIEFSDGSLLSVTPNHPILTTEGWVPAGLLHEGSRVVRSVIGEGNALHGPDPEDGPVLIEDVARPLLEPVGVSAGPVPVSSHDFHGDASDGQVAVVGADRGLMSGFHTPLLEHVSEDELQFTDMELLLLAGLGSEALGLPGHRGPSLGFPGSLQIPAILLLSSLGVDDGLSLPQSPGLNVVSSQPADNGSVPDATLSTEFNGGDPGQVFVDQPIRVGRVPWSGHVYNLQTETGWYTANSVVVHNCLCYVVPITVSPEKFADKLFSGGYDDWLESSGYSRMVLARSVG